MTHFPGFPPLIFHDHEEWEQAASHAEEWSQGKAKSRLGRNDTEHLSRQIFLFS